MSESRKRVTSPMSNNKTLKRAAIKPRIVPTKASQARDKAITAQLSSPRPHAQKKRKTVLAETDPLAKEYHTKASILKERPSWDLRGKVQDMTTLYQLNLERLEKLSKFQKELEILRDEKESQEKEALQKAAALRTELTTIERNHVINIADLHANQRIEYQKLEDNKLNFTRKLNTLEIEVNDARNRLKITEKQLDQENAENKSLKANIEKTSNSYQEAEIEMRSIKNKMEQLSAKIIERESEIEKRKHAIKKVDGSVDDLKAKLAEAHAVRDRLQGIVKELELNAVNNNTKKAVTKLTV